METQMIAAVRTTSHRLDERSRARSGFTEGTLVLITLYALVGLGIGSACGSLLLGMLSGLVVGFFAAAAVLLICGASQEAKSV